MNGRRERIRTSGPYVPNVVLYQAELLSVTICEGEPLASGGALITMPPAPRNRAKMPPFRPFAGVCALPGLVYTEPPCWGVAKR